MTETEPNQDKSKRDHKVIRLQILKPADGMSWNELSELLRQVRYRVFRLANLKISESYLDFHKRRVQGANGNNGEHAKIGELNKRLLTMLREEKTFDENAQKRICGERGRGDGALTATVTDALAQYKLKAVSSKSKWSDVTRGKVSLPTFKLNMAIPVRCDKTGQRRLEKKNGEVELELMVCNEPRPRVVLKTQKIGGGAEAILERLLENQDQSENGYRQRSFEIKQDDRNKKKWWLFVSYDKPAAPPAPNRDKIVGVDVGFSCPLYAAINHGHARLGWKAFGALGHGIRSLKNGVMRRRREIQRGGKEIISADTARSGHGRKRKLLPTQKLEGRIGQAYTTLNHQMSAAVIKFAQDQGAGAIQMEDLSGLQNRLKGTFIGAMWQYHQLQNFIEYKAQEAGIEVRKVKAAYTSQRCHVCGQINHEFDRKHRDQNRRNGKPARFKCPNPECPDFGKEIDADYNAAKNLATPGIEQLIAEQCNKQGIELTDSTAL